MKVISGVVKALESSPTVCPVAPSLPLVPNLIHLSILDPNLTAVLRVFTGYSLDCRWFCSQQIMEIQGRGKRPRSSSPTADLAPDPSPPSAQHSPAASATADSGHESISDEENAAVSKFHMSGVTDNQSYCQNFQNENQDEASWFEILEEADELVCLQNKINNSSFSNASEARKSNRSMIGGRGKDKLKFSIRSHLLREELSWSSSVKDRFEKSIDEATEGPGVLEQVSRENFSMADILEDLQGETDGFHAKLVSNEQRGAIPSVAELLEDLQGKDVPSTGASDLLLQNVKAKDRKANVAGKRMMPSLGSRTLDNEDPPELLGDGMSSEDEDKDKRNLNFATQKMKRQTMTDLFQEAFSKSPVEEPLVPINKHPRHGFHGRLQQVLQIEKDEHLEFLKSQKGLNHSDESRSIDVLILSRILEGKLTVCHCLSGETLKGCRSGPQSSECDGGTTKRTIIFSSKICDNVELEVGNSVRIHPPWKEVQVNEDHQIILCVYFSQVIASH